MIKKVIVYFIVVVAALYSVRELLYMGIRKNRCGVYEKYNTIFLKENRHDVLFVGSSRTEMHFNTKLFDSITGKNSYNIGVTGATPRIAYSVLKAYCSKSEMPQFLVFDLDYHFLKYGVDTIKNFPRYFPYLQNKVLMKQFDAIDSRFLSFKYNPVHSLPYSNIRLLAASLHGWLNVSGREDSSYYKGFSNVLNRDTIKKTELHPFYSYIHPVERNYIDSIIRFCENNSIQMLMLTSPMFKTVSTSVINRNSIVSHLQAIAKGNNLNYYDFSDWAYSSRKGFFTDFYHMNGRGAEAFTLEFSHFFQQYFDKKNVN